MLFPICVVLLDYHFSQNFYFFLLDDDACQAVSLYSSFTLLFLHLLNFFLILYYSPHHYTLHFTFIILSSFTRTFLFFVFLIIFISFLSITRHSSLFMLDISRAKLESSTYLYKTKISPVYMSQRCPKWSETIFAPYYPPTIYRLLIDFLKYLTDLNFARLEN